ncbi:hypothetical protein, partial [Shewanella nanhaiensis]
SGADLIVELGLMKVSIDSEYISANQLLLSCFIICNNGAYHTFCPKMSYNKSPLRRGKQPRVNAAMTFDSMDAAVEAIGIYLRRVIEVFTHQHAASNKYQFSYDSQQANQTQTKPNETNQKIFKGLVIRQAKPICYPTSP